MNKAVIIISKILEVFHWIGCGFMIAISIVLATGNTSFMHYLTDVNSSTGEVEMYGFSLAGDGSNPLSTSALVLFFVGGIFIMALMAMVFRNIYLIFKTAQGETKFSEGATPFQQPIVDLMRKTGIFCIAIPAIELVMTIISAVALGDVETNFQFGTVFFALIILCLSRFFAYGIEIQKDTEGLV